MGPYTNHGPLELRTLLQELESKPARSVAEDAQLSLVRDELDARARGTRKMSMSGFRRRMGEVYGYTG